MSPISWGGELRSWHAPPKEQHSGAVFEQKEVENLGIWGPALRIYDPEKVFAFFLCCPWMMLLGQLVTPLAGSVPGE